MANPNTKHIPTHVAIIMDGNGRWANKRKLPRLAGHKAGTDNIHHIIKCLTDSGVKYVTLYVFSTENWSRPSQEVDGLMRLIEESIDNEVQSLHAKGVRLLHIGRSDGVSQRLQNKVTQAIELTKNNRTLSVCIAFNYGSRAEIVDAIKRMIGEGIAADKVAELDSIAKAMDRDRSYLLNEAVESYLSEQQRFVAMVNEGLKAIENGELIDDEEVGRMVDSWEAEERAAEERVKGKKARVRA